MKILKNILENDVKIRTQKNYPVEGVEFIDITPLIMQKETLNEITKKFVNEIKEKNIDYIIAPEARGFLFATPVAERLNIGCIPIRKKGKLPPNVIEKTLEYQKEYGKDILEIPKLVDDEYKNKNFYIIDDILATGNTVDAIKKGIEELGGTVKGIGTIINIAELNNNKDVFSLININEEN